MSGNKTIVNRSNVALSVILRGRVGADPHGGSLPPVTATIAPQESKTVQYGSSQNPFLNSLNVEENSNGSDISAFYQCLSRGGPGTLDNLFNANSTIEISYNPANYSFALSAHN